MEHVYYMVKGMLSELPKEAQDEINTASMEAKAAFIDAVSKLSDGDYTSVVFTIAIFEIAKEFNIPIGE